MGSCASTISAMAIVGSMAVSEASLISAKVRKNPHKKNDESVAASEIAKVVKHTHTHTQKMDERLGYSNFNQKEGHCRPPYIDWKVILRISKIYPPV
jgi:hypothetical protein